MTYSSQYSNYPGNFLSITRNREWDCYRLHLYSNSGSILPTGSGWLVAAQFGGNGSPHLTAGDTYTVTATVGGTTQQVSGHF